MADRRYVRINHRSFSEGRVGILTKEYKENWFNKLRGFRDAVQVKGIPNQHSYEMFLATSVEEITEMEYFVEKLRGK